MTMECAHVDYGTCPSGCEGMKMAVFWDIALCGLVETDRRFRGPYCLHHQGIDIYHLTFIKSVGYSLQCRT
jgi:hypothetical protein